MQRKSRFDAHYPVRDALAAVPALEVPLLLTVHPRYNFQLAFLPYSHQVLNSRIFSLHAAYLLKYLSQQPQQSPGYLPCLDFCAFTLLPVGQVRFPHVKVLCARTMDSQPPAHPAHCPVAVNRNHECTENGKENAQKTVTTVHRNR